MKHARKIVLPAAIAILAATLLACGPKEDDRARYVAVGNDGGIYYSMDASSWDKVVSGVPVLQAVAWNGEEYVAIGVYGNYLRSEDGRSWTGYVFPGVPTMRNIATRDSRFIAVGDHGSVYRSDDHGKTFAHSNLWGMTDAFYGICWTGSQFCIVAVDGTVATSPDGIDWTRQASISGSPVLIDVVAGGGLVLTTNQSVGTTCSVWSSSNEGVSWTQHTTGYGDGLDYIADSGSVVALVGFRLNQNIGFVATADHGHLDTWTARWAAPDTGHCPKAVMWDGSRFIVAGENGMILISDGDGTSWTLGSVGVTDETLVGLAYR
jgi:hypothetical protein